MNWSEQCAVVIPCHNEVQGLTAVLAGARLFCATIIVVDDGSTDGTAAVAGQNGALCLRHEKRQGKGAALLAGFIAARQKGFSWVLTMDGDGQHAPGDIPLFFHEAEKSGAALIAGNRMNAANEMPVLRRLVNQLMSRWLSNHTGYRLPDSQCGFRLLHLADLPASMPLTRRFEFESELLVALARENKHISFVPVQVIYRHEQSKIRPLPDAWRWLTWWYHLPART